MNDLFKFLILLLPVDSGTDLNSECDSVFRALLAKHPEYAVGLLRESLEWKPTRHRAYVWRLLTSVSSRLSQKDPLFTEASQETKRTEISDPIINREVVRFLNTLVTRKQ